MLLGFFAVFSLSLLFMLLFKQQAVRLGFVDIPNHRSSHVVHTPSGAGIALYFAVAIGAYLTPVYCMEQYMWVCVATLLVFLTGVVDDRYDIPPKAKFVVLAFSAFLLSFHDILITDVGTFFGIHISLGMMALPFTVFAVVGLSNAVNLIDGIDGLAGSISIVILSTFWFIGFYNQDMMMALLSMVFIAAVLGFLFFNWHPASIFMGDSGSLVLGFVISVLAIKALAYLPAVSVLFIVALPVIDTIVVMVRRKRMGRSIFSPDRCHLHHILLRFFGGNVRRTVLFLVVLQAVYAITGIYVQNMTDSGGSLILFGLNAFLIYMATNAIRKKENYSC